MKSDDFHDDAEPAPIYRGSLRECQRGDNRADTRGVAGSLRECQGGDNRADTRGGAGSLGNAKGATTEPTH
ncbi:MAG: hypothetical protein K9J45_23115, partial [Bacteroidales bacterium]|nr:hypothetical protein [Bacteroidales bacterium]